MSQQQQQKQQQEVRVGTSVFIRDPEDSTKVFCGIRKGSHGAGSLALPGGHLEMMESWEDCAKREVKEEMDLEIDNLKLAHVTNDIMLNEQKHYVTIFLMGEISLKSNNKKPINMEPLKCEGWNSYSWNELREILQKKEGPPLFGPLEKIVSEEPTTILTFLAS
eukprot:CAMPEP_0194131894 /NCGR_PEP_ID=MMETSP0152-20130528/2523_1 /TAXON_ID=1049557 /ORGANISM="Thalassiothrix antarctica, Strain L6-D1" /LENGTH=163 /DNA_ID=CAMNT_0038826783 /DNA_START=45 /DNA_END=536 /DNA_ORIENTATION=-